MDDFGLTGDKDKMFQIFLGYVALQMPFFKIPIILRKFILPFGKLYPAVKAHFRVADKKERF